MRGPRFAIRGGWFRNGAPAAAEGFPRPGRGCPRPGAGDCAPIVKTINAAGKKLPQQHRRRFSRSPCGQGILPFSPSRSRLLAEQGGPSKDSDAGPARVESGLVSRLKLVLIIGLVEDGPIARLLTGFYSPVERRPCCSRGWAYRFIVIVQPRNLVPAATKVPPALMGVPYRASFPPERESPRGGERL